MNTRPQNGSTFISLQNKNYAIMDLSTTDGNLKKQIFFEILTFLRLMDSSEAFLNCSWPTLELIDPPGPVTALASRPGKIRPKPL